MAFFEWCKHKGRLIRTSYQICYGSACKHVFAYASRECADEFNLNPWTYLICGFRLRIESKTNLGNANRCGICHRSCRKLVYWFRHSKGFEIFSLFKKIIGATCCLLWFSTSRVLQIDFKRRHNKILINVCFWKGLRRRKIVKLPSEFFLWNP